MARIDIHRILHLGFGMVLLDQPFLRSQSGLSATSFNLGSVGDDDGWEKNGGGRGTWIFEAFE